MMNILPVVFKQICQFSTLNFSKGHTFLEILLPDLSPLWTLVLENMNLFSVQFRKGNSLSWGRYHGLKLQYSFSASRSVKSVSKNAQKKRSKFF